jgi:helicase
MIINALRVYGGSERLIAALSATGIKELHPPQALSIKEGLLTGSDSFVVAAPTASGKTLVAEMAMLKVFFERAGKVIYLVPLRALAAEKYYDFSKKYKDSGVKVVQSTGDFDSADPWLYDADVIITTNEKLDSLIRHRAPWLREVKLIIADEIHLLGDSHRGPTLEIVLTRLRTMSPETRFIALSATIPNAAEIARWLGARLVESDWRPVPLREGVYFNGTVTFNDGTVKWAAKESSSDVIDLALETIKEGGQALIFVNTRKSTEAVAVKASKFVASILQTKELHSLKKLSFEVISASAEPTRLCRKLSETVSRGVAFHHAGINYSQRKLIEDAFRANRIKVIVATTTLAMGLNLPSRRVIIRDWVRYESALGMQPVPAIEIKQMSGRAGRPGFDKYGEAVIVARSKRDEKRLFEKYITGEVEEIDSQLADESALRAHILSSIAGAFTTSRAELKDFLQNTFFAHQRGTDYLSSIADDIVEFLEAEGMIVSGKRGIAATRFGHRVSELYIDPVTAVMLRDALKRPAEKKPFPLLYMIASTPDMMKLSLKKKDFEEMLEIFYVHADDLLIPEEDRYPSEEMLSEIKTASVLMQWILEMPEDKIADYFDIGPGDLRTLVELSDWLLYSSGEIARVFGIKDVLKELSLLRTRVRYGVREELLELVSLRGVGRVRARSLFNAGYKGLKDIKEASVTELAKVPAMGKALAESIKGQVLNPRVKSGHDFRI